MSSSETPYRLSARAEKVADAREAIAEGFLWESTPQGHDYWAAVYRNLLDMENQARMIEADNQPCLPSLS